MRFFCEELVLLPHKISNGQLLDVCVLPFSTVYGKNVEVVIVQPLEEERMHPGKNTVTYEARLIKSLFLKVI